MNLKLLVLPMLLGLGIALGACSTPETTEDPSLDEPTDPSMTEEVEPETEPGATDEEVPAAE